MTPQFIFSLVFNTAVNLFQFHVLPKGNFFIDINSPTKTPTDPVYMYVPTYFHLIFADINACRSWHYSYRQ